MLGELGQKKDSIEALLALLEPGGDLSRLSEAEKDAIRKQNKPVLDRVSRVIVALSVFF